MVVVDHDPAVQHDDVLAVTVAVASQAPLATAARERSGGCVPLPPSCGGWVPQPPLPGWQDRRDHHVTCRQSPRETGVTVHETGAAATREAASAAPPAPRGQAGVARQING